MIRTLSRLAIAGAMALGFMAFAAPASAQASRTWISGVGDDANPCSRTAPCKTFAGAISKTATGGEISCLDPGGFGALTITKSITLSCDSQYGSILVAGTNGININGAGINVVLSGIEIEGLGNTGAAGLSGVKVFQANSVRIVNTSIRGFNTGVEVAPSTAGGTIALSMDNVLITGGISTAGGGIFITPGSVNASVTASISDTRVIGQAGTGIAVLTTGGTGVTLSATVTGSTFSNGTNGIIAKATAGNTVNMSVAHSVSANNSGLGVNVNGAGAAAQFSDTTITGNGTGVNVVNSGVATTFGDNIVRQNTNNGSFGSAPVSKN